MSDKVRRHKSIYLGSALRAFFAGGSVRAKSEAARLDGMARRYEFFVLEAFPRRAQLHPVELVYLAGIVGDWSLGDPGNAAVLIVKLQQAVDRQERTGGVDVGSLVYRLKQCKPSELVAIVDVCEQLLATGDGPTREAAKSLLESKGLLW